MAFEHKDGSGSLFINDKGDNPARPDRRGEIMIGGVLYELSGWVKQKEGGKPWLSLSAKPKTQQQEVTRGSQRAAGQRQAPRDDDSDPIPF